MTIEFTFFIITRYINSLHVICFSVNKPNFYHDNNSTIQYTQKSSFITNQNNIKKNNRIDNPGYKTQNERQTIPQHRKHEQLGPHKKPGGCILITLSSFQVEISKYNFIILQHLEIVIFTCISSKKLHV